MAGTIPNYNPIHVAKLLTDVGIRKSGYKESPLYTTPCDEWKAQGLKESDFFVRAGDLIDDTPTIDSVMHDVLSSLNERNLRDKRAIDLVYGLPDSEPLGHRAAGQVFYKNIPPDHKKALTLPLEPNDEYIMQIVESMDYPTTNISSVEVSLKGDFGVLNPERTTVGPGAIAEHKSNALYSLRRISFSRLETLIKQQ